MFGKWRWTTGKQLEKDEFVVENSIPYADIEHMDNPDIMAVAENDGFLWSHTLEEQILRLLQKRLKCND